MAVTAAAVTAFKQMKEELEAVETMHRNGDVIVLLLIEGMGQIENIIILLPDKDIKKYMPRYGDRIAVCVC